jgi:polysaccharide pyruvyl transferase CsaB
VYRIGISGSYGGINLGDEAILEGIVGGLRASTESEITIFTRNEEDTLRRHDVDRAVEIRNLTREEARRTVAQLDLFVLGGGGILYDRDAETYLREVELAAESDVPVMLYAISAGPLEKASVREAVRERLSDVSVITVRDSQGKRLLEDVGVKQEIEVTADPAFVLQPDPIPEEALIRDGLEGGRRKVGFSVREPGPAAPDIDVGHYHALLANAADFVIDRLDADVVFVPMERNKMDMQHSHAVIAQMHFADRASVLKGAYTSRQLITLIGRFEFCVGMRLHFLIFSALAHVPFVALPYASKVMGLVEDLEMEMPPLRDVRTGRLIAAIDRSWDHRDEIRTKIQQALPELVERAGRTNELLQKLLRTVAKKSDHRTHAGARETS